MKKLAFLFLLPFTVFSQNDLAVSPTVSSPTEGCGLGDELITVVIVNTSGTPYSGTLEMGYTLNGGTAVTENETIGTMPGSGTYIYTFTATVDLSACQEHDFTVWVYDSSDPNNTNDTITFQIASDCAPTLGAFLDDSSGCVNNVDTLIYEGYNFEILDWGTSTDGGTTWSFTGNTSDSLDVMAFSAETEIAVIIGSEFGLCDADTAYITLNCALSIDQQKELGLIIPTIHQSSNGAWIIQGLSAYPKNELHLFDLQGKEVFQTTSYQNNWSGSELPEGIYIYQLSVDGQMLNGKLLLKK